MSRNEGGRATARPPSLLRLAKTKGTWGLDWFRLPTYVRREAGGQLPAGSKGLRSLRSSTGFRPFRATQSGARFPGEVVENPERVEVSAEAPSGFLTFQRPFRRLARQLRENANTGREKQSGAQLVQSRRMFYFSSHVDGATRRRAPNGGKPPGEAGHFRRETTGSGQTRPTGNRRGGQTGLAGNCQRGQTRKPGNRPDGHPAPTGNPRRRTVGRPSGDPSGSSNGLTASRPKGLRLLSGDGEGLLGDGECGSGRSDLRVAVNPGTAVIFGSHSRRLRPPAPPDRSWVPGPTMNGIENPERVEASAKAPSGFLASWGAGPSVSR